MKVGNKLYSSIYGLKKVERSKRSDRDRDDEATFNVRSRSFAELQAKYREMQDESGYQSKLDPRIAIALSVANSNRVFSIQSDDEEHADIDIVHDHSENRGKTTNIEV